MVKNSPANAGDIGMQAQSLGQEDPWRKAGQCTAVLLSLA